MIESKKRTISVFIIILIFAVDVLIEHVLYIKLVKTNNTLNLLEIIVLIVNIYIIAALFITIVSLLFVNIKADSNKIIINKLLTKTKIDYENIYTLEYTKTKLDKLLRTSTFYIKAHDKKDIISCTINCLNADSLISFMLEQIKKRKIPYESH